MKFSEWKRWQLVPVVLMLLLPFGCSEEEEGEGKKGLKHAFCTSPCLSTDDWTTVTVDSAEGVGEHSSLALASNDALSISYYDAMNQDLKFAACTANCITDSPTWTSIVLDATGDVGKFSSLKFDSLDNPHISYYDATAGDLRYAFFDIDSTEWKIAVVDSEGDVGWYTSLVIFNDAPRIAYYDRTNGMVKFAYCDEDCDDSAEWSFITVAATGDIPTPVERAISLVLDSDGNPLIAFYDVDGGNNVGYIVCTQNCTLPVTSTADDSPNDVGQYPSLILDQDGKPIISYYDASSQNLKLVGCIESCASVLLTWSEPGEVDSGGNSGLFNSLVLDADGFLRIAYYDLASDALKYGFCFSLCGNSTNWTIMKVDRPAAGTFASLALDNGNNPHISYLAEE